MRLRSLLPLALLLATGAPAQQLPIHSYTVADGLAEDRVNCIVADSRGYIWIGTAGGLSRFDGYRMKTYGVEDGLPDRTVNSFAAIPSGGYLIGSQRGLSRLENHGAHAFAVYPIDGQAPDIEALLPTPSGRTLVGSRIGVFEADNAMSFRPIPLGEVLGRRVSALARDHDGNLWVSTEKALAILGPNGVLATFQPGRGLPSRVGHAAALVEKPPGRMWAATNAGLLLFDRSDDGSWRCNRLFTEADGLGGNDIGAIETGPTGHIWLGTSEGITRFLPESPLPPRFENWGRAQGLSGRRITALARDPAGNMWAGTESAGVMRIARQGFLTYRQEDGLPSERVAQVLEDRFGELVAVAQTGVTTRGIGVFDGSAFRPLVPAGARESPWGWQQFLLQAKSGEWWTASQNWLLRYPAMKAAGLATARPIRYPQSDIYRIFEDSAGGIWASANPAAGGRLLRWDPKKQALSWFCKDGSISARPCLSDALIMSMAEDSAHNIWLGRYDGGLVRYTAGQFTGFTESDGVPSGAILSLLIDRRGRLWIATNRSGLGVLADSVAAHPRFEIYDKSRGLSSNGVCCMLEDDLGRLYAGTARGIDRLDPATGLIRHFSSLDGVPYGAFTSAIRDRSGAIWFASRNGLTRLVPEPSAPRTPLKVFITGLQAGGEDYPISQLGETRIAGLQLGPSRNRVQVEFVAPADESAEDLRYAIQLTGAADKTWSAPRAEHSVDYRNLAAGNYRFLVKAVDPDGLESAVPAEVSFTILPPLWKRWWFELALLSAAIALAYGLHAYRLEHILALERMRTAIATDLHDDIGSSLAQIAVLSEVAQVSASEPRNGRPMARIGEIARELTDSLNDIVWSIRSGDESLESLTRRMREFSAEFLEAAGIEFSWKASAPPHLKLTLHSRRQIFLILKESLHNVVTHSGCRSASVTFEVGEREAVLTVSDDGTGLNGHRTEGNGLPNMRRRAESLGGCVEFAGAPGGGCRVTLRLPVRRPVFGDLVL